MSASPSTSPPPLPSINPAAATWPLYLCGPTGGTYSLCNAEKGEVCEPTGGGNRDCCGGPDKAACACNQAGFTPCGTSDCCNESLGEQCVNVAGVNKCCGPYRPSCLRCTQPDRQVACLDGGGNTTSCCGNDETCPNCCKTGWDDCKAKGATTSLCCAPGSYCSVKNGQAECKAHRCDPDNATRTSCSLDGYGSPRDHCCPTGNVCVSGGCCPANRPTACVGANQCCGADETCEVVNGRATCYAKCPADKQWCAEPYSSSGGFCCNKSDATVSPQTCTSKGHCCPVDKPQDCGSHCCANGTYCGTGPGDPNACAPQACTDPAFPVLCGRDDSSASFCCAQGLECHPTEKLCVDPGLSSSSRYLPGVSRLYAMSGTGISRGVATNFPRAAWRLPIPRLVLPPPLREPAVNKGSKKASSQATKHVSGRKASPKKMARQK